jgi:formate-dependent nitrite reductase membrane component NrfD
MVPDATFTSYYGRPVLKASPWEADIPAYLFLGGLAAGSSLLAAGADVTGRPTLRRGGRAAAAVAITGSLVALVHDLGRPMRFLNMLRVAKPTSPMSVGTWILSAYAPMALVAAADEALPLLPARIGRLPVRPIAGLVRVLARPSGLAAAVVGPAVASYTAVLLADTATPSWHEGHRELPFVFVGSAGAASGGLGLVLASRRDSGPARRLAVGGAVLELVAEQLRERAMGLAAEPLHQGTAGRLLRASKTLTVGGAVGAVASGFLTGRPGRLAGAAAGTALVAGSVCTRFGVFEAGQASARDPKYTVVPQRERLRQREAAGASS